MHSLRPVLLLWLTFHTIFCASAQQTKTTFQTTQPWKPTTDIRADAVMVYGAGDRPNLSFGERVESWRKRGYQTHFMTGIGWGNYRDYFSGRWDGRPHWDEGQKTAHGDTILHGPGVPYIVPTANYLRYFKETQIKPAIDAGICDIFLEEPEFWARAGYSESFQREWAQFYGFPWRAPQENAENLYLANKLKYHLYYRALNDAFTFAKDYGQNLGRQIRCYVPTHSLLNYSMWQIVSPEASLASMSVCDGYIAQVWTGTSRVPNYFNGQRRERVFETAFLEYGSMESMTRPTGRKMFFLTDPIEDGTKDWADYRRNYQATFSAQLLYPQVKDFEVMPWPDRIYEGRYRRSSTSDERIPIPQDFATQMQVMINALGDMPSSANRVSGSPGVSVAMANSLMFQRSEEPVEGYDDPQLSNFFGLALPLLKRGVPVNILHLENTSKPETWADTKVLLLSYSNLKPLSPAIHDDIARWVSEGGCLIYAGRDDDAFQHVSEWWNQGDYQFAAPSEHLFATMNLPVKPMTGIYACGKGRVFVLRQNPKEWVLEEGADALLVQTVRQAYGQIEWKNSFVLQRGPYAIAAVMDESPAGTDPLQLTGEYVDLFDPSLPVVRDKVVNPGEQAVLYDLRQIADRQRPCIVAAASRQYDVQVKAHRFSFVAKSPAHTQNAMRIYLPKKPKKVSAAHTPVSTQWDEASHTLLLQFANSPEGVRVSIRF